MPHSLDTVSRFYLFARHVPNNPSHVKVGISVEYETRESVFLSDDIEKTSGRLPYQWVIQFDMSYGLLVDVLREVREAIKACIVEVEDEISIYRSNLPFERVLNVFRQNDLMSEDDFPFFHIWTEEAIRAWQEKIQPFPREDGLYSATVCLVVAEEETLFIVDPVESDDAKDLDFVKKLPNFLKNFHRKYVDHVQQCVLCETGSAIHNAHPLAEGRCCDDCHSLVMQARFEQIRRSHFPKILTVYYKGLSVPAYESETWNVQYFVNLANRYYLEKRPNFANEADYVDSVQKALDGIHDVLFQTITKKKAENQGRSPYNMTNTEQLFEDAFGERVSHSPDAGYPSPKPYAWALFVQVLLSAGRIANGDKNGYLSVQQGSDNSMTVDALCSLPVCACGKFADIVLSDRPICKECFEAESKIADENARKLILKEQEQEKKPRHVVRTKDPEKEKIKELFRCLTPPPISKQRNASGMLIATQSQIDIALNNWKNNPNKPNHAIVYPYLNRLKLRQGTLELKFK